jgi:hypothetical protein
MTQQGNSHVAKSLVEKYSLSPENLYAQTIITSLDIFITVIDQCRHLITQMPPFTGSSGPAGRPYRGLISARERKELDEVVELCYRDIESKLALEVEELRITVGDIEEYLKEPHHPVSPEAMMTMSRVMFQKVYEETLRQHFSKYEGDPIKLEYILTRLRLGPEGRIEAVQGDALVPLIVSKMEEFLAALVRTGVTLHPKSLGDLPSIPDEVFQRYRSNLSRSDIMMWQVDQKVTSFMKGSPEEWRALLLQWAKIDISNLGADWAMITELIQRRHVIVHNGGQVDAEYVRKVSDDLNYGLQLGSRLISDRDYILPVLVELETWAICLALRWSKHFFKESKANYPFIFTRITGLEEARRWTQALAVLETCLLEPASTDSGDLNITKINRWFCLQELGRNNEALRREIYDMEAGDQHQEMGKYALLGEYDALSKAIRRTTEGPKPVTTKKNLTEMPLLQRAMRESTQIRNLLLRSSPPSAMSSRKPHKKRGAH